MSLQTRKWKPKTFDPETLTAEAVIASERPVPVFDWGEGRVVEQYLLMSGASWPETGQVPLLDSHQRDSTTRVLGSARDLRIDGETLLATINFSDDEDGRRVAGKIRDGHLTDLSIGYEITAEDWIPAGESKTYGDKTIQGPASVALRWRVLETSCTPIGADESAKIRSEPMKPENADPKETRVTDPALQERQRVIDLTELCAQQDLPEFASHFIRNGATVDQARAAILDHYRRTSTPFGPGNILAGVDETDKRREAILDGMLIRAGVHVQQAAPGANEFRNTTLLELAKDAMRNAGQPVNGMSPAEIFQRSMSTSDFPNLLSGFSNKALREQFLNSPATFHHWCSKGSNVDFKDFRRLALSEGPDLAKIEEAEEYTYAHLGEGSETFKLAKHGRILRFTWEMLVNDDLDSFARLIRVFTSGARRQLNKTVYETLADGTHEMADGYAIFATEHSNLSTSGGAPSIELLSEARSAMRLQTGLLTEDPLNIGPKFMFVPAALESEALELLNTEFGYADADRKANPFYKRLELVVDPVLDGIDSKAWFLAADPTQFDTIEVVYLDGNEVPYTEEQWNFNNDSWDVKCRFVYAVAPVDYRGLYKNPGQ